MLRYTTGNLLDAQAEALVNTFNEMGVMGTHSQPEGWVEGFLTNPPTGSFDSPEAVAKAAVVCFRALGNRPFTEAAQTLKAGAAL